jgi:hypothetical protein
MGEQSRSREPPKVGGPLHRAISNENLDLRNR